MDRSTLREVRLRQTRQCTDRWSNINLARRFLQCQSASQAAVLPLAPRRCLSLPLRGHILTIGTQSALVGLRGKEDEEKVRALATPLPTWQVGSGTFIRGSFHDSAPCRMWPTRSTTCTPNLAWHLRRAVPNHASGTKMHALPMCWDMLAFQ